MTLREIATMVREYFRSLRRPNSTTPTTPAGTGEAEVQIPQPPTVPSATSDSASGATSGSEVSLPPPPPSTPLPPPAQVPPRLGELHIWAESYDGRRYDDLLAKVGWPHARTFVHANDGDRTVASRGRRHVHALHFYFAPWNNTGLTVSGRQNLVDIAIARARKLGASAVSIDHETHFIMWGPNFLQYLHDRCDAADLPLIHVPLSGWGHLLDSRTRDDWAWTRSDRFNMSEQAVAAFLQANTAISLQWYYGPDAQVFLSGADRCERLGYTRPLVPLMDGAGRLTAAQQVALAETIWQRFGSIGLFNPAGVSPDLIATLRRFAKE